jgi:heme exporter protein B
MSGGLLAILRKDLRIELRSREGVTSLLVLGLLVLLVLQFASPERSNADAAAAGLWIAFVLAGTVGAQRSFLVERENLCLHGLVTAPVEASTIYLAKMIGTTLQLGVLQLFTLPLVAVFFDVTLFASPGPLLLVCGLANLGFSAVATLFAAIAVRTRAREVMLPLLVLPLVAPLLIAAVGASSALLAGQGFASVSTWVQVLAGFDVVFVIAGWLLFEHVIRE